MDYFLGFDGGGTKTDCVLADATGWILARANAGASNPVRSGFQQAWYALGSAANAVIAAAQIDVDEIRGVCAGLAGASQPHVRERVEMFFRELFPRAQITVTTDLALALQAAVGDGEGVVLIAGTGSAAFGRNADGRTARAGGWGPWISDEGSAFDAGRRAFAALALAGDGRGPATALAEFVREEFQIREWTQLIERIARHSDDVLPRMFPLLLLAADQNDEVARRILVACANDLAALVQSVLMKLELQQITARVAKWGGMFGHNEWFDGHVDAAIKEAAPLAELIAMRSTPAEAAAERARLDYMRLAEANPGVRTAAQAI